MKNNSSGLIKAVCTLTVELTGPVLKKLSAKSKSRQRKPKGSRDAVVKVSNWRTLTGVKTMKTTADFRAVSTDLIHWYAQVWSEYAGCYVDIKSCKAFNSQDSAIVWAMHYWK